MEQFFRHFAPFHDEKAKFLAELLLAQRSDLFYGVLGDHVGKNTKKGCPDEETASKIMKKFILLFSENVEIDVDSHFFVKFDFGGVFAHFLDGVFIEDDVLAVHFDASGFLDSVGNHDGVD